MKRAAAASLFWLAATPVLLAAEEAVEGTSAEAGAFPPFETAGFASQLFWLAVTFGFFYWFLKNKALPKLERTIEGRQESLTLLNTDARRFREEADAAEAAYTQALAEARQNAQGIAGEARDSANADAASKRAAAEAELDAKLKQSEASIARTKAEAMSHVEEIAEQVTGAILSQVTGRTYDENAIRGAVQAAAAERRA